MCPPISSIPAFRLYGPTGMLTNWRRDLRRTLVPYLRVGWIVFAFALVFSRLFGSQIDSPRDVKENNLKMQENVVIAIIGESAVTSV
jgi:hypothetical protein